MHRNTPLLTTEADLADPARAQALDDWWHGHGRFGHFSGCGGLALAWAAFDRPGARAAVVISSGRTESQLKYIELVHDLWQQGYAVWLHDHRGQGLSAREPVVSAPADRERGHVERFDDYVDDLRCFVDTCVRPAGHARRLLLAHSMGGLVGALLLEQDGDAPAGQRCFDAAALCAPMFAITGPGGRPLADWAGRAAAGLAALGMGSWWTAWDGGYDATPFEGNPFTHSRPRYERWRALYARQPELRLGAPTLRWLAEATAAGARAQREAQRIAVPVQLLAAGADRVVHLDGMQRFCAGLRQPGPAPLHVVPGAAHELLIEQDAARGQALAVVLGFFERCLAGLQQPRAEAADSGRGAQPGW